jgi:poly-gamma-glutamate capsule biosynthesis protein CapA/YwtB (metallophosphatase superfamily)
MALSQLHPAGFGVGMAVGLALALPAAGATAPATPTALTVSVSGDLLIHGPVFQRARAYAHGRGYDFRPMLRVVRPLIAGADLAICHLETPLTYGAPSGYPSFHTPAALAGAIKATGWDACDTASNHSLDAGQAGINTTALALNRAHVKHTGSFRSAAAARKPLIMKVKSVKVAFLAYTALTNGQAMPHPWSLNLAHPKAIISAARRARRAGAQAVIVNLHWGNEYQHAPSSAQWALAGTLTRSSAITAVVGQHVHVVQPIRWIHGKPVVFGEGNLLSNQTHACCVVGSQDGLIAFLDLQVRPKGGSAKAVRVRYLPTYVRHPDFTVIHARGVSRHRTIAVAGHSRRTIPIR